MEIIAEEFPRVLAIMIASYARPDLDEVISGGTFSAWYSVDDPDRWVADDVTKVSSTLLDVACAKGRLPEAEKILAIFPTVVFDVDAVVSRLLDECEKGSEDTVRFLCGLNPHLTLSDVQNDDYCVIAFACDRGGLELVQFLAERFALDAHSVREYENMILRSAFGHGNLTVANWLVDTYALTAADANDMLRDDVCAVFVGDMLEVVQWLVEKLGFGSMDFVRAIGDLFNRKECEAFDKRPRVEKWMQERFPQYRDELHLALHPTEYW